MLKLILTILILLLPGVGWGGQLPYVQVSTGSVTLANTKMSLATDTAFVDLTGVTLSNYIPCKLTLSDGSKTLSGFIRSAETGETLDTEALGNGNFETCAGCDADDGDATDNFGTWTEDRNSGLGLVELTATANGGSNAVKLTRTTGTTSVWQQITPVAGALYKLTLYARGDGSNGGTYFVYDATNSKAIVNYTATGVTGTSYTLVTKYFTVPAGCTSLRIILYGSSVNGSVVYFDDVSLKQVLTASSNGVKVTSATQGASYNWTTEESAFDRNKSTGYTYTIYSATGGSTYYVSASGNGTQDGQTYANRWAKEAFNTATNWGAYPAEGKIGPGDTVYICGAINEYRLSVQVSGDATNGRIVFDGACPGDAGIINRSDTMSGWGEAVDGVYPLGSVTQAHWITEDGVMLTRASDETCADGNWYWIDATDTLYYKPTSGVATDHTVKRVYDIGLYGASKSYITIQNLTFKHNSAAVYWYEALNGFSNITVQNCTFTENETAIRLMAAATESLSALTTTGNTFDYCGQGVVHSAYDSTGTITTAAVTNNLFTHHGQATSTGQWRDTIATLETDAISFQNPNSSPVSGNTISGKFEYGIVVWTHSASETKNNTIIRNKITGSSVSDGGIVFSMDANSDTTQGNLIALNQVSAITKANALGISVGSGDSTNSNKVIHNTVSGCTRNFNTHTTADGWNFYNNISANPTSYHLIHQDASPNNVLDYNLYYPDTGTKFQWALGAAKNFADYKTASSQDANSPTPADPLFVSATDFHLQAGSPAINAGVNICTGTDAPLTGCTGSGTGYYTDYDSARTPCPDGTKPDIGAYERCQQSTTGAGPGHPSLPGLGAMPSMPNREELQYDF